MSPTTSPSVIRKEFAQIERGILGRSERLHGTHRESITYATVLRSLVSTAQLSLFVDGSSSGQQVPIDEWDTLAGYITPGWQGCSASVEGRDIPRVRGTQDMR